MPGQNNIANPLTHAKHTHTHMRPPSGTPVRVAEQINYIYAALFVVVAVVFSFSFCYGVF